MMLFDLKRFKFKYQSEFLKWHVVCSLQRESHW